jgi:3-(3-hydroxy-phenyl)propionate hydroxylase
MTDVRYGHVWRSIGPTPQPATTAEEAPVVIAGAGPVGLAMALDLGRRGHRVTVLTRLDYIAAGSKAICFSKRSLDIMDRLGVGQRMVDKGVTWNVGKVFWKDRPDPVYQFDLLPVKDQKRPAFINLQQYYVEEYLVDALAALPNVDIRWGHEVRSVAPHDGGVAIEVGAPDGDYAIDAEWLIACDGNRSPVRTMLGLDFEGRVFEDNFLIADIRIKEERPSERWFWFDPPFNPGKIGFAVHKPARRCLAPRLPARRGDRQGRREESLKRECRALCPRRCLGPDVAFDARMVQHLHIPVPPHGALRPPAW